ncbi:uncharacterized protein LODBEIA_P09260 [Lodderomyces beijingensis]|uniref:Urea active transporter n=1 Tax=Lodderomyces beijingensis TaxID=1775926 RepID=A0ABP0ZEX2_9ASCO
MFDPLPQAAGYAVVLGLGAVFAMGMMATTYALRRYTREIITAEEFTTAGRSVKTGLISCAVVSSWTWAATLLTSTTQVYNNGASGGVYYACGATCQITLFACLAIKAKLRAPNARTYLEIVYARYGVVTHCVYITWGLLTNTMVTAMLLTGGCAVVHDLTGMNPVAACILTVIPCCAYASFGGLKSVILGDYVHTVIMLTIILIFGFVTWSTSSKLGSPGVVWELVSQLATTSPREGNAGGSYLTLHSRSGGISYVINIVGGFGTVFLDNGYFNKAFAANPASTYKGYILGSLAWLPIPAFCSLTMGLGALALQQTSAWPLGRDLTPAEVASGLVLPTYAVALMGKAGGVLTLLMLFMAVTSAFSAQLISVSSIVTYDIYRTYVNKNASGKKLIWVSHVSIIVFAALLAALSILFYYVKVSMGYLFTLLGIVISGGVLPQAMTILWKRQSWAAATFTPPIATCLAITFWLVVTKLKFGAVTYDNTFMDDSVLTGNCVALLVPIILVPALTYLCKPQNFDWSKLLSIKRVDEEEELKEADASIDAEIEQVMSQSGGKVHPLRSHVSEIVSDLVESHEERFIHERQVLSRAFKRCVWVCGALTLALLIVWPMPMYGAAYIFSRRFFTGWVVVFFIWIFYACFQVIVYPIWESRDTLRNIGNGIYWDLTGQSHKLKEWQVAHPEELHVVQSQIDAVLSNRLGNVTYAGDKEKR